MFPDCIDNTIRSSFVTCPTQAKYAYIEDWSGSGESVHLHFGGAFAAGLEAARRAYFDEDYMEPDAVEKGIAVAEAYYGDFEPPMKSPKTRAAVGNAIRYYFGVWSLDLDNVQPIRLNDGSLAVEWKFKIPIPGVIHPDHGGPIYFVGRSDMLAKMGSMLLPIEDDKSASQLGDKWISQWPLDSQFMGYSWAAGQTGIIKPAEPCQALIRGVGIYTPKYVNAKTGKPIKKATPEMIAEGDAVYDLMSSFGNAQAHVSYSPWEIERWLAQFVKDIKRMIYAYLNDEWELALKKEACGQYGGCNFDILCQSQHPDQWKEINFVKRKWNPLETV